MNLDEKWTSYWESVRRAMQLGKYDHAEPLLYAALDIAEDFEPDDQRLVMTLECLAEILFKLDRPAQAESVVKRIISIYEKRFGPNHPDVGVYTNNLGLLYHSQKKFFMAESEYQKALSLQTKALGSSHPQTLNVMANYARLLNETHREREAKHLEACIKGAQTGNWKRSGSFKAYSPDTSPSESLNPPSTSVNTAESLRNPPPLAAQRSTRPNYRNAREEDITLQDVAIIPPLSANLASEESNNAVVEKKAAGQVSMMQRLLQQRKQPD